MYVATRNSSQVFLDIDLVQLAQRILSYPDGCSFLQASSTSGRSTYVSWTYVPWTLGKALYLFAIPRPGEFPEVSEKQ